MAEGQFVAYYRVSTARQGRSGLGLEAQRAAVLAFLNGGPWTVTHEFTEVESGKRDTNRPQLQRAIEACKLTGARLVIAKLDRLSRDAHFLLGLEAAGVDFVAADMPNANRLTVRLMAVIAQEEREMISRRTREALAAARARGVALGGYRGTTAPDPHLGAAARRAKADEFAARVRPVLAEMQAQGLSFRRMAAALAERGVVTPGGGAWTETGVRRVLARLGAKAREVAQGARRRPRGAGAVGWPSPRGRPSPVSVAGRVTLARERKIPAALAQDGRMTPPHHPEIETDGNGTGVLDTGLA